MKMRGVLLAALLALTAAPLLSGPAASSQGGPAVLGNHDISIQKLAGTNTTVLNGPGPYVLGNGHTAKFTNNTLNNVTVKSYNSADAEIASAALTPGQNTTFTQSTGASEISYFIVTDSSKNQTRGAVIYSNQVPGIGGTALLALAILLLGSAAWALTRRGTQTA